LVYEVGPYGRCSDLLRQPSLRLHVIAFANNFALSDVTCSGVELASKCDYRPLPASPFLASEHTPINGMSGPIYNALIRTHHITSRKKVTKLKQAATNYNIYVLLRYGGPPGVMYCQGSESGVRDWVSAVQRLRYKDFQLVKKPAAKEADSNPSENKDFSYGKLEEVDSVKDFGAKMSDFGVWGWWRKGMGYVGEE